MIYRWSGESWEETQPEEGLFMKDLSNGETLVFHEGLFEDISVRSHSSLENLTEDSHPQYWLTEGRQSDILRVRNSTQSTSPTTGSLIVSGGVGIGGRLNVGGSLIAERGLEVTGVSLIKGDGTPNSCSFTVQGPMECLSISTGKIVCQSSPENPNEVVRLVDVAGFIKPLKLQVVGSWVRIIDNVPLVSVFSPCVFERIGDVVVVHQYESGVSVPWDFVNNYYLQYNSDSWTLPETFQPKGSLMIRIPIFQPGAPLIPGWANVKFELGGTIAILNDGGPLIPFAVPATKVTIPTWTTTFIANDFSPN